MLFYCIVARHIVTVSTGTLRIVALSIITHSITSVNTLTLGKVSQHDHIKRINSQHNDTEHSITLGNATQYNYTLNAMRLGVAMLKVYSKCHYFDVVMLNVFTLKASIQRVAMLSVIVINVVMI